MFENRPLGKAFVRNGENECNVEVITSDKVSICRIKTKKDNYYTHEIGSTLLDYEALRGEVPEDVQATFNLSEVNVAFQFDGYYLALETPGRAAAKFNKLTDLEHAQEAVASCSSRVTKINSIVEVHKENLEDTKVQLKAKVFGELERFRESLDEAQKLEDEASILDKQEVQARGLLELLHDVKLAQESLWIPPDKLGEVIEELQSAQDEKSNLDRALSSANTMLANLQDTLDAQESLWTPPDRLKEIIYELNELNSKCDLFYESLEEAHKLHLSLEDNQSDIELYQSSSQHQKETFDKLIAKLKVCPKCGQKLSESAREELLK